MYYLKDTGYIIKRVNISEADRYITILTQNNGKIDVLAKGVRKLSSRRSPQLELLNKISFQAVGKTQNSRLVLTETRLVETHATLKNTLESMKVLFTICELVSVLCPVNQRQEEVFSLVDKTLAGMGNTSYGLAVQSFQVKLLSLLGYWDANRAFIDAADVAHFTESVMERKIRSSEFF
ncbi:MAG: DNA repair protein RecO [Candidatus Levyibacteriota bacterium]